jgi:hypothetical protein
VEMMREMVVDVHKRSEDEGLEKSAKRKWRKYREGVWQFIKTSPAGFRFAFGESWPHEHDIWLTTSAETWCREV